MVLMRSNCFVAFLVALVVSPSALSQSRPDGVALSILVGCTLMLFFGLDKVGGWDGLMAKADADARGGSDRRPQLSFLGIIVGVIYGGTFYWGMDQGKRSACLGCVGPGSGALGCDVRRPAQADFDLHLRPARCDYVRLYPGLSDEDQDHICRDVNNLLPSGLRVTRLSARLAAASRRCWR